MAEQTQYKQVAEFFAPLFTFLFILMGFAAFAFSIYLIYASSNAYMYAASILFMFLSIASCFFTVFTANMYYRSRKCKTYVDGLRARLKPLTHYPTVAVAVPCFNEDPKVVRRNLTRLMEMNYPKDKLHYYLLDDSTNRSTASQLERFSRDRGVTYIHRDNRAGFKAGAFNNMIKNSKEEFIAIFDHDEYLTNPNFLIDMLPFFEDKKLSYIQTEKRSSYKSFFSDTVDLFNGFFYRFVQSARVFDNTAMFAGSCGILRMSALKKVGGFPEFITEDTFFSFESDINDYKAIFIPEAYALGGPIESFSALAKQQWRYNYGVNQFLGYFFRRRNGAKKKLDLMATIDYVVHGFGLNFLSVVMILFTIASILLVLFSFNFYSFNSIPQLFMSTNLVKDFEIFGMFSFLLSFLVPIMLAKVYFNSVKKGVMLFLLNYSLAFIRTRAAIAAILGRNPYNSWIKSRNNMKNNLLFSLYNTRTELAFATMLFAFAVFALFEKNVAGTVWLVGYGVLYALATVMFYKYG
jgi:cellulose synthase (UDP-forming)